MGDENSQRIEPLVRMLPRQPGAREARYAHLLTDANAYDSAEATDVAVEKGGADALAGAANAGRLQAMEAAVAALTERVRHLEEQLGIATTTE